MSMHALVISLQTLIITVRKNVWSSVLTTLLLLVLIVAWSARDNIASFIEHNPSPVQEKQRFDQSVVADAQINDVLEKDRATLNADRMLIRQFHNSKTDLTGLPFSSISTTYFALAPGVSLGGSALDAYPLSSVNDQLSLMFIPNTPPRCSKIDVKQVRNPVYLQYMNKAGVEVSYACPLINLRGEPVGFIGVGYLTREKIRPDDMVIEHLLDQTGEKVVGYLTNITAQEHKPWYSFITDSSTKNNPTDAK